MLICAVVLLLLLPAALLPLVIDIFLPTNELGKMGIQLETNETVS